MFGRMLIPLDGSKTAEDVLPYARRLAADARVAVELLGVVEMAEIAEDIASNQAAYAGALVREAVRNSTEYLEKLAQTFHNGKVRCNVQQGRPEDIIIAAASADRATLIAMATHGRSGVTRWLLGSVTEKVLRGTVNPLLVVRAPGNSKTDGEAALRSVIVPLDGSDVAETILSPVAALAKALDLQVLLIRVYGLPLPTYGGDDYYVPDYLELKDQIRDEAEGYLNSRANLLRAQGVAEVSTVVIEGSAADAIIDLARKTPDNLVALSPHGRSGLQRWVLGSVTEKVVRHSQDPVLIVRES
ncbi:MAG TPA: universal stress protein [Candidatus Nitrosocosmicus sp.]|nr:universal stress protein [Candidatus Nitrosocosmicus sp.]